MNILLIGGSKSGKSLLAQEVTHRLAAGGLLYYWATMEPADGEDRARIRRHLAERDGWGFATVERGRALPGALPGLEPEGAVLLDSVTALLANEMFSPQGVDEAAPQRALEELLTLSGQLCHLVCVCDDVFRFDGAYDPVTEAYRAGLAHICRGLAKRFDTVAEVSVGVPHVWKGEWPV